MIEISSDKVVQVVFLAREREMQDGPRSAMMELHAFIDAMNDDEKAHLTAIAWVGRGVFEPDDYDRALATAMEEHASGTSDYLMGMPHLAENLEAGLDAMGVDVDGEEEDLL